MIHKFFNLSKYYLPILFIYSLFTFFNYNNYLSGDEARYMYFAQNILKGFYSPPYPDIELWNGPGYPLLVSIIIYFVLGKITLVILNVCFLFSSILLMHLTIFNFSKNKFFTLILVYFWGLYFNSYQEIPRVLSESFSVFLISLICYLCLSKISKVKLFIIGIIFGYLILTKIIFFYVFLVFFICYSPFLIIKFKYEINKYFLVGVIIILSPYLFYTYKLTGNMFYLSNAGGDALYWMSNPYEHEFGDWNNFKFDVNCGNEARSPCNKELIKKNHGMFFSEIKDLPPLEKDKALFDKALENITNNPIKYMRNYVQNLSRLFFNFPNSYFYQQETTIYRIIPNSFVLVSMFLVILIILVRFKQFDKMHLTIYCFSVIYILISGLFIAQIRQFYIIVPALIIVVSYSINRFLKINS